METTVIPSGTVVVGVDGSPSAALALEWAIDHAGLEHRPLTLAHAVDLDARHDDSPAMLAAGPGSGSTSGHRSSRCTR